MVLRYIIILILPLLSLFSEDVLEDQDIKIPQENPKTKLEILKLSQEGQEFLKLGKSKEAEIISQKIKNISEQSAESYYIKAGSLFLNNDFRGAQKELEIGLKLNQNHDPSLFLLGLIFFKNHKFENALFYFEKASKEATYNPFYRYNLSLTYYILGNYLKARIESETTIKLKENYYKAKILLGNSLYKLNKKSDSYKIVKELIDKKIEVNDIQLLYLKLLLEESKNYEEIFQILGRKNSLNIEEKRIIGNAYMEEGQYIKAIQFFKMVIDNGMDTEEDNLNYLKSLIMIGKSDEAERLFMELNKKNFRDKKIYLDTYYSTLEKKYFIKQIYQPFPI